MNRNHSVNQLAHVTGAAPFLTLSNAHPDGILAREKIVSDWSSSHTTQDTTPSLEQVVSHIDFEIARIPEPDTPSSRSVITMDE